MSHNLHGKVAVVTGGGGVLGSAFAKELARVGAKVAILNRSEDKAKKVADDIAGSGGIALAIACDVLDKAAVERAAETVKNTLGPCDILINAAGGNHPAAITAQEVFSQAELGQNVVGTPTFFDMQVEGFEAVFRLNFMGTFIPSQVFLSQMAGRPGATVINISSMSAFAPLTKVPAYSAAKAAVSNFTQWLAVHFAEAGVRVNALAPGFFLTEQNRMLLTNPDGSYTARAEKIIAHTPMRRFGQPEDLLGTLLWLADEKASGFVTGIVVPVDGGFMAYAGV
ncbi:short-chain dehydrogenase/reductase SDR [Thermosinus carboxydivorans Nor1]|uniref:Short-chain dehydrogenase/reductase SDR n=1 Tax=Thermosinus carboxydivorans Nor1 TaxID=401526 RepID=A1HM21_9FIRM|nr:SDR family oxidoreductase [Thermosinus carboxydivorans]EAX48872.1 short-chain dehydrogenase/reductase SDR [Thermosinus carboxydivorans Nor1]